MNRIDRRGMILGAAGTIAALALPAPPLLARDAKPALFVFDGRIARARETAMAFQAAGIPLLDRDRHDLGQAWRSRIPALMRERGGSIAGLTLWVDSYICETFGRGSGLTMQRGVVEAGDGLHRWALA